MTPFLSIVIPAWNEQQRLPGTLTAIIEFCRQQPFACELIVVDDGSTDATAAVAERMQQSFASLEVLRLDHRGKGFAVRQGMLRARGHYVLFADADLAVPIAEWHKLQPFFERGYDVVIGSREGIGARRVGEPRYRHVMGRVFNFVVRAVALGGIQDSQCGFKAFTFEAKQQIFGAVRLYGADARTLRGAAVTAFDVEVLFLARRFGYRIAEVPITWHYGVETKVDPLRDSLRNFRDVLRVRWNELRGSYKTKNALTETQSRNDDPRIPANKNE